MSERDRPRAPIDPEELATVEDRARGYLLGVIDGMNLGHLAIERRDGAGAPYEVVLEFTGQDADAMVGKNGETIDALQLLCNRMLHASHEAPNVSVVLDAGGHRARREKQLEARAQQLGTEVRERGKVITLEPMTARERRVVHNALARFPGVTTRSEGEGLERRLQIIPMPPERT